MPFKCFKHLIEFCRNGRGAVGEHALGSDGERSPDFPYPRAKKDLWSAHTPEVPSSRSDAPSPSSWSSPVRSRRTVRKGVEDRSWFGCPQAIKKAAGNAAQSGFLCVEPGGPQPASPVPGQSRERSLRTAKKMGVFPKHPRVRRIAPFHRKGSTQRMTRGMATQRRRNDQTTTWVTGRTKKEGSLIPPKKTHSPLQRGLMELSRPWSAAAMRRNAHLKGGVRDPPEGR